MGNRKAGRRLNPRHIAAILDFINQAPYFRHLRMPVREIGLGFSLVELTIGPEHLNPFGGLHGGAYASAIDTAAYWAVYGEMDEEAGLISIDLKVDFLAPAHSGLMTVKGRRIKTGKTMCLAEATAFDANGRWLAHGTSKIMVTESLQTLREVAAAAGAGKLPPKFL